MSTGEDKKSISSIEVIKKTEKASKANDEQIGVEADIPVETDEQFQSDTLFSDLKVNENVVEPKKVNENIEVESRPLGDNIKVFNISSGKVIETKITSEPVVSDKEINLKKEPIFIQGSERKGADHQYKKSYNKLIIIFMGIVIFLIVVTLIMKSICENKRDDSLQVPSINLPR